jgi:hypothetical protein
MRQRGPTVSERARACAPLLWRDHTGSVAYGRPGAMSTMSTLAIVFSVLGGLLEISGLALVVREIVADRVQARTRFAPRSPSAPPERADPAPLTAASWASPSQASVMSTPAQLR